jgi:hypothetical protein
MEKCLGGEPQFKKVRTVKKVWTAPDGFLRTDGSDGSAAADEEKPGENPPARRLPAR